MRISTKFTTAMMAVFVTVSSIGALAVYRQHQLARQSFDGEAAKLATTIATTIAFEIQRKGDADPRPAYREVVAFIAARDKADVEIVDHNLIVLADVVPGDIGLPIEPGPRRTIIAGTLRDGMPRTLTERLPADGSEMRQVVVPIYDARRAVLAALTYEYTPLYNSFVAQTVQSLKVILSLALAGIGLALGAALYIARRLSQPLEKLRLAAHQLSQGRRDVVVDVHARNEIGELAAAFNTMSTALRDSQVHLERRADELLLANKALHLRERAMESTFNAIVIASLTRPGMPIEYVNPAFERITGYTAGEALGKPSDFLAHQELDQPALHELQLALQQRREGHAVVRSYRKDGTPFWNEVYVAPVRADKDTQEHYVAIFNDITHARNDAEQLAHQAQFDQLTGLANRNLLLDRLHQAIANAQRRGEGLIVAFIDLDDFKQINDNLGHELGDNLLKVVAQRLRECTRASDTVARLGGDEFVLVFNQGGLAGNASEAQVSELARKILERVGSPLVLGKHEIRINCSMGLAAWPQDGEDADTLLKHADIAMYRAKELGRNGFQFFTAALQERARQQLELGASLRQALERDEFELHYQPQVSLRSGKVVGVEALLRWRHPQRGLLGPGHFIGFAEETGLIIPIGEWVLMRACAQNKAWQDAGLEPIPVAVNVSAKQCAQPELESAVRRALDRSGLPARYLELELTESISMADPASSVPMMDSMKAIGIELSIDDFGTGYSNMSYLRRFPIDRLKLDISFVRDITTDPSSLAISDAIVTMAHSLHLEVVAEGVETEGQLALLASRDCDIIQGFFFCKPLAAPELAQLLQAERRLPPNLTARPHGSPGVLVLDDDAHLLAYLELVLANEGYTVHATADPGQAFELLACHAVAVVLCDQRMPAMTGIEFLSRVRRMHPHTTRIMLSAYDDYNVTRQAINMGAVYKFIEKPVHQEELVEVVNDAFRLYLSGRALRTA